ncbi:MAG TPA: DUF2167 domain-containing protein [Myxococcaceae bacterium]|jgi:uncharacterized membrane-anchored protein
MHVLPFPWLRRLALALATAGLVSLPALAADEADEKKPEFNWQAGPADVDMAGSVALLKISEAEAFLDPSQTRKLLERSGNQTSGKEVGLIRPLDDDASWWAIFEWEPAGYVKDDEKDKIDADELLKSISEGTEEGNDYRKEHGAPALHVVRWSDPPHYDAQTHNLTWGILAKDENGGEVVNHQVRVLGREGFMAVTLIDDPKLIEDSKVSFNKVMEHFAYKPGRTYSEWRPGDKVAEYGLTALVAAGAGAAALKLGFFGYLAKFAKVIVIGLAAAAATVGRFFKRLFGRGDSSNPNGP